jgi:meso-butanediol dehydrogenase / (S,S)-butanediol dehydrogenase / diacetyl reductase
MNLQGKVALVTGAGQGVGQGIALALAAQGARVAVSGRTLAKLEATVEKIQARGGEALPVLCDVKSPESLQACVDTVIERWNGLNILVNNAQEVPLGRLLEVSDEAITAGWESGPMATLRLMKLCYPYLKGDGVIINLGSSAAKRWDMAGYAACEWGPDNIRCNAILPHALSPALEWWLQRDPAEAEAFFAQIPQRRIGDCEQDIGRFVALLCSEGAGYVNGQSIALDGGQAFLG